MWPILIGVGIIALIAKAFESEDFEERTNRKRKRIFISFAFEDQQYRDYLVNQAKNERSPFDFVDMSVKQPWDEDEWKIKCRERIRKCDGVIVLLGKKTVNSSGVKWEIKCAKQEGLPVIGMHIKKDYRGGVPLELKESKIITWTWANLKRTIKSLN